MKKQLAGIVLVVLGFLAVSAYSQQGVDMVYLKDGEVIKGVIIEEDIGVGVKLKAMNSVMTINYSDISKIVHASNGEQPAAPNQAENNTYGARSAPDASPYQAENNTYGARSAPDASSVTHRPGGYGVNFTDPGSIEIGGAASYAHVSESGVSVSTLTIAPVVNFFPAQYFMLGPAISFTGEWESGTSVTAFGLGFNTGLVYPIKDANIFLYLTSGVQVMFEGASESYDGSSESATSTEVAIPVAIGVKIPIQKNISLNIGPSFLFYTSPAVTQFMITCGFTGLIY